MYSEVASLKGKMIAPPEGFMHEERWKCGKISGDNPPSSEAQVHNVILNSGIPAQEAIFLCPLKSSCLPSFPHNLGTLVHFIKFRSLGAQESSHRDVDDLPVNRWKTF